MKIIHCSLCGTPTRNGASKKCLPCFKENQPTRKKTPEELEETLLKLLEENGEKEWED